MRRLPEQVKRRIVEHLACFQSHAEVKRLIEEEFGIEISRRQIRSYDPDATQFAGGNRWLEHYGTVRDRYYQEAGKVAIAHKAHRLHRLSRLADDLLEKTLAADDAFEKDRLAQRTAAIIEQAAKEMGNFYQR